MKRMVMFSAWKIFRAGMSSFADALRKAWAIVKGNARRIAEAGAGITEEVKTWYGWKEAGYEVRHGSKALFGCELIRTDGRIYKAAFFGRSQVE